MVEPFVVLSFTAHFKAVEASISDLERFIEVFRVATASSGFDAV